MASSLLVSCIKRRPFHFLPLQHPIHGILMSTFSKANCTNNVQFTQVNFMPLTWCLSQQQSKYKHWKFKFIISFLEYNWNSERPYKFHWLRSCLNLCDVDTEYLSMTMVIYSKVFAWYFSKREDFCFLYKNEIFVVFLWIWISPMWYSIFYIF